MWKCVALIEASTSAGRTDLLMLGLLGVTIFFSAIICIAIVYLSVKYRRGHKVDRSNPPHENLPVELTWTIIPTLIALGLFVWATATYFVNIRVPTGAMQINVVGKQWMWKLQHPEGRWEMNELHIPVDRPIQLTMTSEDVIHSFFVPAFRVKQDVVPGRYSEVWFQPTKIGHYRLECAQFCGTNHSGMVGWVDVLSQADYEKWLSEGNNPQSVAAQGEGLFLQYGCSGCHGANSNIRAPLLDGIYGKPVAVQYPQPGVPLEKIAATTIVADDRYIHDSIVDPTKEVVAGYRPIMPTFKDRVSEAQILELIAYIKSLTTSNGAANSSAKGNIQGDYTGPITQSDIQSRTGFTPKNIQQITRTGAKNVMGNAAARERPPHAP